MHRSLIALLSAFDAAIAAAVGVAVVLAPATVLWVFGSGGAAPWDALWPTVGAVWQLGQLVPLHITLPGEYLAATGIDEAAASFVLSLAPLGFAVFTAIFAARSGARAARAGGWITGVLAGGVVFAVCATAIALTARSSIVSVSLWQAVLLPALLFAVPALGGALVTEWREGTTGIVARVRDRAESRPHGWGEVPGLAARGVAVVLVGLIGLGGLGVVVALIVGGAQVIALFEAGHMDALGATITTLAQLAYLPTLVVWAFSFIAGPGFALGTGTAVSPTGTQLGVLPGVPVLGAVPSSTSPWLLLLVLLPIALGAFAGWIVRSHLVRAPAAAAPVSPRSTAPWATSTLEGLLGAPPLEGSAVVPEERDPTGVRLTLTAAIAVGAAVGAALLAALASGSIGPGALAQAGPAAGAVGLAVGLEVFVGAGILLLSPHRRSPEDRAARASADEERMPVPDAEDPSTSSGFSWSTTPVLPPLLVDAPHDDSAAEGETAELPALPPAALPPLVPREPDGPAPRRPAPLPPID